MSGTSGTSGTDARAARLALADLLDAAGTELPGTTLDRLERYVELLLEANLRLNLTRVVDPDAVARLHLLDSLAALPLIDALAARRALDLGSGGGAPGLVLAIARHRVHWTLVDSVRKKTDALTGFVAALGLSNVSVVAERAEVLGQSSEHRESYDLVTARACAPLPVLAEYALPLVRTGGQLLAWKGRIGADELTTGAAAATLLGGGAPSVKPAGFTALGDHRFVVVAKRAPTPAAYPRRPGEPARRPL